MPKSQRPNASAHCPKCNVTLFKDGEMYKCFECETYWKPKQVWWQ